MIIEFSKDIKLNDWMLSPYRSNMFYRKASSGVYYVKIIEDITSEWSVNFYHELHFMNSIFDIGGNKIFTNVVTIKQADFVKKQVDDLLIKISKIKAFI